MKEYLLLLPIIFIFHDMEEVVGFGWFFRRNPDLFKRFPRITKAYIGFTDMGLAAAVYEEFIPFFGISLLAYYFPGKILYALWFGLFLSLTAHFIVHIGQTIYLRKYIPSFITSIICLPISVIILLKASKYHLRRYSHHAYYYIHSPHDGQSEACTRDRTLYQHYN